MGVEVVASGAQAARVVGQLVQVTVGHAGQSANAIVEVEPQEAAETPWRVGVLEGAVVLVSQGHARPVGQFVAGRAHCAGVLVEEVAEAEGNELEGTEAVLGEVVVLLAGHTGLLGGAEGLAVGDGRGQAHVVGEEVALFAGAALGGRLDELGAVDPVRLGRLAQAVGETERRLAFGALVDVGLVMDTEGHVLRGAEGVRVEEVA